MFKYFAIFRKALSGTVGKNLLTMEFPLASEEAGNIVHGMNEQNEIILHRIIILYDFIVKFFQQVFILQGRGRRGIVYKNFLYVKKS